MPSPLKAVKKIWPGTSSGTFSHQLSQLQRGETTAQKMLKSALSQSADSKTPQQAAQSIMEDVVRELMTYGKKQMDHVLSIPDAIAKTPDLKVKLEALNKLDLADPKNHAEVAKLAQELVGNDPRLRDTVAGILRGNLWRDCKKESPIVSPTELADSYDAKLDALHKAFEDYPTPRPLTEAQTKLIDLMSTETKAVNSTMEMSHAEIFRELDRVAKANDKDLTIARAEAKISELETARDKIQADLNALKSEIAAATTPTQKAGLEERAEKMQTAIEGLDKSIRAIDSKKIALEAEAPNPEKNENLALAIGAVNKAVNDVERVAPAINHTRGNDPKYIDRYQEIDTSTLKTLCENDAYKKGGKEEKTGDILRGLQTEIDALNKATEALKTVAAKMVTPEAQAAYEEEYKACLTKVDHCCAKVARITNDPANRDLIDAAFTGSKDNHEKLSEMTKAMAELDRMNVRLNGGFTAGVHRDLVAPIDNSMEVSKDNSKKMGEYFTFKHEHLVRDVEGFLGKRNEYQTSVPKGADGNPISLSREEIKQLIAQWNKEHPDQKPPIKWDEKKGKIECGTNGVKTAFIGRMVKCYDDRCAKEAKAVTEKEAPAKKGEVTEKDAAKADGHQTSATGVVDDKKEEASKEAGHQPVQPGGS